MGVCTMMEYVRSIRLMLFFELLKNLKLYKLSAPVHNAKLVNRSHPPISIMFREILVYIPETGYLQEACIPYTSHLVNLVKVNLLKWLHLLIANVMNALCRSN